MSAKWASLACATAFEIVCFRVRQEAGAVQANTNSHKGSRSATASSGQDVARIFLCLEETLRGGEHSETCSTAERTAVCVAAAPRPYRSSVEGRSSRYSAMGPPSAPKLSTRHLLVWYRLLAKNSGCNQIHTLRYVSTRRAFSFKMATTSADASLAFLRSMHEVHT